MSEDDGESDRTEADSFTFVDEAVSAADDSAGETSATNDSADERSATAEAPADETATKSFPGETAAADDSVDETASAGVDDRAADAPGSPDENPADAPLTDLARDVARRRSERTPPADAASESDPFEEMDVDDVDTESLWEDLVETAGEDHPPGWVAVGGEEVTEVESEVAEHVVPKRQFCQQCRYFTEPPEVACTHDGAEIVELTDSEHFRVRACPMVGQEGREFE